MAAGAAQVRPPSLERKLAPPLLQVLPPVPDSDRRPGASGTHRRVNISVSGAAGQIWRQAIRSPGAVALRVHFSGFDVGSGRVWLHDGRRFRPKIAGPYGGRGIHGDGEFWSDVLYGDTVVVEYEPSGSGGFEIPEISHLWDRTILGPRPPALADVKSVYIAPMTGRLETYLAQRIRSARLFALSADPARADAVWTEGVGTVELVAPSGQTLWSCPVKPDKRSLAREIVDEVRRQAESQRGQSLPRW